MVPKPLDLDQAIYLSKAATIQEQLAIEKALNSTDVNEIMKAQTHLKSIKTREDADFKSILVDPNDLSSALGYKNKPFNVSYEMLRAMSRTHIVRSIIETRKEQVSAFCTPKSSKSGVGFIIQKKEGYLFKETSNVKKLTKQEEATIEQLMAFVMQCGTIENTWHADDFDDFIRKIIDDSLTLDQATFEVPRNRGGQPVEFFATDAATFRIADSYEEDNSKNEMLISGYAPSYVQVIDARVIAEFYPWELCFGTRNPSSSIYTNGYGRSELEDMIQTVTAILNADTYNANFFRVGSAPKGILKYSGNINPNTVEDFRRQWTAQVSGVMNMHKIPMINADKLDFINTGQNNKDMEFAKFQEFLIKISCAMYKIDPAEVGFPMQGTAAPSGLGGDGGTKEKLQYSKSKGLKPLIKKTEKWLNKYVIQPLNPQYELKFVGIDDEEDEELALERDIKLVSNIMTLNEMRAKRNLPAVENGDVILNPTFLQAKGMAQQGQEESNQAVEGGEEQNPYEDQGGDDQQENPFMKSLQDDLALLLNKETWSN
jgi:hypothetical protein